MKNIYLLALVLLSTIKIYSKEYHVSALGDDNNSGSKTKPFKTILAAARVAHSGDLVIIHKGIYRERVDPPRGGVSEDSRIVYQAAPGEEVVIKGSEIIKGWTHVENGVWKVTISNRLFGTYNPYNDVIGTDWYNDYGRDHHTGEVYLNNKSLYEVASLDAVKAPKPLQRTTDPEGSLYAWFCSVDKDSTTLTANFHEFDPNKELVEINVREACFYPSHPGINYITVRGFKMSQAACQWSTATDEQNGVIGTHWSKGWIIENNVVTHAKNIGIALGKDRKSGHHSVSESNGKPGYLVYNEVILRALLESGWNKDNVGSHIVRNNTIYNCEKNGIHGSLGAVFSRIENNHIYNIYTKRQYFGFDIGGIKILGPIDVLIKNNHIHDAYKGMWMDWMTQGTRITSNLLYRNEEEDVFIEVNHGPYVIDNNLFLSEVSLRDWSQGGAYIHNLFAGRIERESVANRKTPYHKSHTTMIAGLEEIFGGDNRFYNNIFVTDGLDKYNKTKFPMHVDGNVYYNQAESFFSEKSFVRKQGIDPQISINEKGENVFLNISFDQSLKNQQNNLITTDHLGKAFIPNLPFEDYNGTFLKVNKDYMGIKRDGNNPTSGPFEKIEKGVAKFKVW